MVKVRARGHVYPKAAVFAYGVHDSGRREVIGLDIGETETETFWIGFLRSLRERRLAVARLAISDDHTALEDRDRPDPVLPLAAPSTALRLAGALLIEQNDRWLVGRRYLSEEPLALVL